MLREKLDPIGAARTAEFAVLIPGYLKAEDITALVLFLASDESPKLTVR